MTMYVLDENWVLSKCHSRLEVEYKYNKAISETVYPALNVINEYDHPEKERWGSRPEL